MKNLTDPAASETERAVARASMLLERYGIVSREAARAEELRGGFAPVYQAFRAMEEAGRVRRGYFVEGFGGAQFARPGAVDRLRGAPAAEGPAFVLSAVDPANPYGALLPWPETSGPEGSRPRRVPSARVVHTGGAPALYLAPGGRELVTFTAEPSPLEAAVAALLRAPRPGRRALTVETVDGLPVRQSALYPLLLKMGFRSDYRGVTAAQTGGPARTA